MAEYCEITDLIVSECAHCKGVELVEPEVFQVSSRFSAQYRGRGICGHPIEQGDRVGFTTDGELLCQGCAS